MFLTSTFESAGSGTGSVDLLISAAPDSPTGARLFPSSAPGGAFDLVTHNLDCAQTAPGIFTVQASTVVTPFFPYPINNLPACSGIIVHPGAQAVRAGTSCSAGDFTATWSVAAKRATCNPAVDTDGGGVGDCREFDLGGNPGNNQDDVQFADNDRDGVPNGLEQAAGSDPNRADTDGDGISDAVETQGGKHVDTDLDGIVDARDGDSDGDGIPDALEGTGDSDGDGKPNYIDFAGGGTPCSPGSRSRLKVGKAVALGCFSPVDGSATLWATTRPAQVGGFSTSHRIRS